MWGSVVTRQTTCAPDGGDVRHRVRKRGTVAYVEIRVVVCTAIWLTGMRRVRSSAVCARRETRENTRSSRDLESCRVETATRAQPLSLHDLVPQGLQRTDRLLQTCKVVFARRATCRRFGEGCAR